MSIPVSPLVVFVRLNSSVIVSFPLPLIIPPVQSKSVIVVSSLLLNVPPEIATSVKSSMTFIFVVPLV